MLNKKEQFIKKSKERFGDKFDYSKVEYIDSTTPITLECKIHGEFEIMPVAHLRKRNKNGCPKCNSGLYTTETFIEMANKKHANKYSYNKTVYVNSRSKVIVTCPVHGDFTVYASMHLTGERGCQKCSNEERSLSLEDFILIANKKHSNKYIYDKTVYVNSRTKVIVTCPIHGDFTQLANMHLQGQGCPSCHQDTVTYTREQYINIANIKHNNKYSYSNLIYTTSRDKVTVTCPTHGDFNQLAYMHLQGQGCPICACGNISIMETMLANYIKSFNSDVLTSTRNVITPHELDITIPSKYIAIEFNGNYWHSDQHISNDYHLMKTENCIKQGYRLIHIFEDEWVNKQAIVKSRLKHILTDSKYKIYGRKCNIKEIDNKTKSKFLEKYHIQGDDRSSVRLGLFYKNRLIAVMTFCKARFSKEYQWELSRFCTISNFVILGGASKLLTYFERIFKPSSLVTYADRRWSDGNVYEKLGFNFKHFSNPNYFYIHKKANLIRESRNKYQKHKLKNLLENFDESKSEVENMLDNGYYRIFDSGNYVFTKIYT